MAYCRRRRPTPPQATPPATGRSRPAVIQQIQSTHGRASYGRFGSWRHRSELYRRGRHRHDRDRDRPDVLRKLIADTHYQLKFVVDQLVDLGEIVEYLKRFPDVDAGRVWLMPQGTRQEELEQKAIWLGPAALQLGYRFCPRRHIELFGSVRGT